MPSSDARLSITPAFTLDGSAQARLRQFLAVFDGGKQQSVPINDGASQNDNYTLYEGPNLNVMSLFVATNNTTWDIDVALNFTNTPFTLSPGGCVAIICPGDAARLDAMNNGLYGGTITLSSNSGGPGTVDVIVLGVE